MTLPTPDTRGYARPMEEVAKVISGAPFPSNASKLKAQAVLALLRKLGFISDLGISAIEAERAMK